MRAIAETGEMDAATQEVLIAALTRLAKSLTEVAAP
jgi:hypothetical protein